MKLHKIDRKIRSMNSVIVVCSYLLYVVTENKKERKKIISMKLHKIDPKIRSKNSVLVLCSYLLYVVGDSAVFLLNFSR